MENHALWERLERFDIGDPNAAFTFAQRLARENSWSTAKAERAITEYKKFIYLIVVGDRMRTPSEAVDQVWHLHLTYSQSYWDEMCGALLGRRIHHGPTKGGVEEHAKFDGAYRETLEAYRAAFGEPPADLWPSADIRFAPSRQRWVDEGTHWVVPKLRLKTILAGAAASGAAVFAGAVQAAEAEKKSPGIALILGLGALLLLIFSIVGAILSNASRSAAAAEAKKSGGCTAFIPMGTCGGGGGGGKGGDHDGGHDGGHGGDGGSGCGSSGCGGGGGCGGS